MNLEKVVADLVQRIERRYYGKYRGLVVDNADPERLGRLKMKVPSVLGADVVTGWALPCTPFGGDADQGLFFIPEVGAGAWVEFEEGDLEFPIWVGTYWSKPGGNSEAPKPNAASGAEEGAVQDPPTRKIIKTKKGHTIQFEDSDDAASLLIYDGANHHRIALTSGGITITDGANTNNSIVMDQSGVILQDTNGNKIVLSSGGIQLGSSSASQPFVLGNQFSLNVTTFLAALSTHTHVGNLGAPTSPPVAPMNLQVPLSIRHKVE